MPKVTILTVTRASDWSPDLIARLRSFDRPIRFDNKPLTYEWVVVDNSRTDALRAEVAACEEKGLAVVYHHVSPQQLDENLATIASMDPDPIWLRWHRIVRELPIGALLNIGCSVATGDFIIHFQDGMSPVYTPDFLTRHLMSLSQHRCYLSHCEGQLYTIAYHKTFWNEGQFDPLDSNVNSKRFLDTRREQTQVAEVRKVPPVPPKPVSETVAIATRRLATQFCDWPQTHERVMVANGIATVDADCPVPTLTIFDTAATDYVQLMEAVTDGRRSWLWAIHSSALNADLSELVSMSEYIPAQVSDGIVWAIDGNLIGKIDTNQDL